MTTGFSFNQQYAVFLSLFKGIGKIKKVRKVSGWGLYTCILFLLKSGGGTGCDGAHRVVRPDPAWWHRGQIHDDDRWVGERRPQSINW